jgi:hypothetical protein
MNLDTGTLTVYRLQNVADPGMMPIMGEIEILQSCYGERTVGTSRYYNARQADTQVDMLVRIIRTHGLLAGDRVRLAPYGYEPPELPYLIDQIQQVTDEDTNLPVTDLALRAMTATEVEE